MQRHHKSKQKNYPERSAPRSYPPDLPFDWQDKVVMWGCVVGILFAVFLLTL